ncbi:MAG TPA: tRNA lysidine(34) synthetase TilS [Candidatus Limiplasma sp.]|nr:tRNA lysidine(34) synthetase TilS [Candidatus Limiplasma sp.]HRX09080.1 tRNA lysidine(34) synthetase TilS [Candidatus Limiplasma sp.]
MDERLISAAEATLRRAGLLSEKATVLVALSGGADSVALLLTMQKLRQTTGIKVYAAHVEHGLRGEDGLEDAAFCEALCKRLKVPFTCDHARLPGSMDDAGVEAAAREARYTLLLARARECRADALLLAHHQDDQAETVLQHLLRGSGARGVSGMDEITQRDGVTILRPFLSLSKQALVDALDGEAYRTDESNLAPVCQRNRLRLTVMPLLTRENPAAITHIAQSAVLCRLDETYLMQQAEQLLHTALIDKPPFFCLHRVALQSAHPAVALRTLRRFAELGLERCGALTDERSLSAEDSLRLLALVSAPENTVLNLPGALHAMATERYIHLTRMEGDEPLVDRPLHGPVKLNAEATPIAFGDIAFSAMPHNPGGIIPDGKTTVVLTERQLQKAVLRTPLPGDAIRPFGAGGSKLLRRYLTDQKLDPPFRRHLPVVAIGNEVLWAVGVGAAESTRLQREPSILLTLQGTLPWYHSMHQRSTL